MSIIDKIPKQKIGLHSEYQYQRTFKTILQAQAAFQKSRTNLLDVNRWQQLSGLLSGKFTLVDKKGINVYKSATADLYIKIRMPVPTMVGSNGFDWVKIENISEEKFHDNEWIIITVRPVKGPDSEENTTTHFFTSEATSNFCVERKGTIIKASIYGRNERPNIYSQNLLSRLRNWIIGILAGIGLNALQWNSLVKGIITKY